MYVIIRNIDVLENILNIWNNSSSILIYHDCVFFCWCHQSWNFLCLSWRYSLRANLLVSQSPGPRPPYVLVRQLFVPSPAYGTEYFNVIAELSQPPTLHRRPTLASSLIPHPTWPGLPDLRGLPDARPVAYKIHTLETLQTVFLLLLPQNQKTSQLNYEGYGKCFV